MRQRARTKTLAVTVRRGGEVKLPLLNTMRKKIIRILHDLVRAMIPGQILIRETKNHFTRHLTATLMTKK